MPIVDTILAAAPIVASGANMYSQGRQNKKARRQSQYFFDRERENAVADWDKVNAYNHPSAVKQRLKDAHLNPALVYGQGSTGSNASSISETQFQKPDIDTPQFDQGAFKGAQELYNSRLQRSILQQNLENAKEQENLISAQTLETLAKTDATNVGANRSRFDLALHEELRNYTLSESKSKAHQASAIVDNLGLETKLKSGELRNQQTHQNLTNAFLKASIEEKQKIIKKMEAEIINLGKEGKLKQYEIDLHNAGTQKTDPWYFRGLLRLLGGDKEID